MDDRVKDRVSELLSEASRLLSSFNTSGNPSTWNVNAAVISRKVNSATPMLNETRRRAQGSTSSGLYEAVLISKIPFFVHIQLCLFAIQLCLFVIQLHQFVIQLLLLVIKLCLFVIKL